MKRKQLFFDKWDSQVLHLDKCVCKEIEGLIESAALVCANPYDHTDIYSTEILMNGNSYYFRGLAPVIGGQKAILHLFSKGRDAARENLVAGIQILNPKGDVLLRVQYSQGSFFGNYRFE